MRLLAIPTVAVMALVLLTGCLPASDPEGTVAPSPTASRSPSLPAEPTATPLPDLTLPTCDELFTPAQVLELMGDGMELIGDATTPESNGGFGTSVAELQAIGRAGGSLNCTWVLPASERGLTVSLMVIDASQLAHINEALDTVGAGTTPVGGGTVIRSFIDEGDYPFTEAHGLTEVVWVGALDGFGQFAPALVQAALDTVIALNPGRF